MKLFIATLMLTAALVFAPAVSADTVETKTECTTGSYGQQTCKTVEVKKDDRVLGETTPHKPVDSGLAENIMFAAAGIMAVSVAGLAYSRVK